LLEERRFDDFWFGERLSEEDVSAEESPDDPEERFFDDR
jgi:hypothetical protein